MDAMRIQQALGDFAESATQLALDHIDPPDDLDQVWVYVSNRPMNVQANLFFRTAAGIHDINTVPRRGDRQGSPVDHDPEDSTADDQNTLLINELVPLVAELIRQLGAGGPTRIVVGRSLPGNSLSADLGTSSLDPQAELNAWLAGVQGS